MNSSETKRERNKKRKESYVVEIRKRFVIERDRYMLKNEINTVKKFNLLFGFSHRYTNDFTGKTDRAVMIWVLSHMRACDEVLRKESGGTAYMFNFHYVITGKIQSEELKSAKDRIAVLEFENKQLYKKYQSAKMKGQTNA